MLATSITACTHTKVEVNKVGDKDLSCSQISSEIVDLKILKKDIDDKTGFSGRNVGMGLIFWPGIVVNQMNASDAEERADERLSKLVNMHDEKKCDPTMVKAAEKKMAEEAEEKKSKKRKKN